MKLKPLFLAAAAALALSSCNMEGTSEATPRIGVAAINLATQDTLGFTGNRLDTVCVGDTIQFQSIVNGMYNGLLEYHIVSSDTAHVEFLCLRPDRRQRGIQPSLAPDIHPGTEQKVRKVKGQR